MVERSAAGNKELERNYINNGGSYHQRPVSPLATSGGQPLQAPTAEAILGTSPTAAAAGHEENWANAFKKHVAQRRALPTTIESFEDSAEENNEVNFQTNF